VKKQNFIKNEKLFFGLYGDKPEKIKIDFFRKIRRDAWIFSLMPFVLEVAVCNSVAFGTASEDSDIDLLFVLKDERFFMARAILSLLLKISGKKRGGDCISRRYCLSFLISDSKLAFDEILIENDVYFYYWFRELIFLKGNKSLQDKLLKENLSWFELKSYEFKQRFMVKTYAITRVLEFVLSWTLFDFLEDFLAKYQIKRARRKNLGEGSPFGVVIEPGFLKFHNKDMRKRIKKDYFLRLR